MRKCLPFFACVLVLLLSWESHGQLAPERLAWNNLGKESWNKAEAQVKKALRKDSLNLGAIYTYAWFYFTPANPKYNIDSASLLTFRAQHYFRQLSKKDKERNLRSPFDSLGLLRLRAYIDSTAFIRAKEVNSVESYAFFIKNYATASQLNRAIELQEEVAFLDALKENTYQSFDTYINTYPQSGRVEEARKRYEKLLFESKTKDQQLNSFINFLKDFPNTPYRHQAEQQIFELSTASGEIVAFQNFLKTFPANQYADRARNFLYYFLRDQPDQLKQILTDSLRKAMALEGQLWVPSWKNGGYSFLDINGNEHISGFTDTLDVDVICEGFNQDILLSKGKILSRSGHVLATDVIDVEDLGFGFLLVDFVKGPSKILHKSGVYSLDREAKLVGHHFLFEMKGGANLYTLGGRKILSGNWSLVTAFGDIIAFKNEQGYQLVTAKQLGLSLRGQSLQYSIQYDEIKSLDENHLWVKQGEFTGILDQSLQYVMPLANQQIEKTEDLIVIKKGAQVITVSKTQQPETFDDLQLNENWKLTKRLGQYQLTNKNNGKTLTMDSVYLLSFAAIAFRNDSTFVLAGDKQHIFSTSLKVSLLSNSNSSYLLISENDKKTLIDPQGEKLFTVQADNVDCVSADYFTYQKKDKRILVNRAGVVVSLNEFDAFGSATTLAVPVLSKKKFGLINRKNDRVIKPSYDRNLTAYNDNLVVAYKNAAYGFVGWDDKPLGKFEFDEIRYWNDSVALVKHNFSWRFLDLRSFNFRLGKITEFTAFKNSREEHFMIYKQDNFYGVLSNLQGVILEPTYTSIKNMGSNEQPFYMTDKFVEEAEIHIIIYYDQTGKQIRRQIYEEHEFDHILCK